MAGYFNVMLHLELTSIGHCVWFVGHSVRTWTGTIFDRGLNSFAIYQWHFTLCICRLWTKCIPRTADSSERLEGVCQAAILNSIITKTGPCVL